MLYPITFPTGLFPTRQPNYEYLPPPPPPQQKNRWRTKPEIGHQYTNTYGTSNFGPIILQGGHHDAVKSTITNLASASLRASSNSACEQLYHDIAVYITIAYSCYVNAKVYIKPLSRGKNTWVFFVHRTT